MHQLRGGVAEKLQGSSAKRAGGCLDPCCWLLCVLGNMCTSSFLLLAALTCLYVCVRAWNAAAVGRSRTPALRNRAIECLIGEYLRSVELSYTESVFMPESGADSNGLSPADALDILQVSPARVQRCAQPGQCTLEVVLALLTDVCGRNQSSASVQTTDTVVDPDHIGLYRSRGEMSGGECGGFFCGDCCRHCFLVPACLSVWAVCLVHKYVDVHTCVCVYVYGCEHI